MSFFKRTFGKKNVRESPSVVLQQIRETEELLHKKQEFLEQKINEELQQARKNAAKNKTVALQSLKRKKRYEKQLEKLSGALTTIEMQREALEETRINTSVVSTMKSASDALEQAHKQVNVEEVYTLMDDIGEQLDMANEASDAISFSVFDVDIDEDELEKELQIMEQEELDGKLTVSDTIPELPAPVTTQLEEETEEDKELKELVEWASL